MVPKWLKYYYDDLNTVSNNEIHYLFNFFKSPHTHQPKYIFNVKTLY